MSGPDTVRVGDARRPVLARTLALLAALTPLRPTPTDRLRRSLAYLGWAVPAERLAAASGGATVVVAAVAMPAALLAPAPFRVAAVAAAASLALGTGYATTALPTALARLRRTAALGEAPALVGRLVLRMHVTPTTEAATAFAVETGEGPLTAALAAHRRRDGDGTALGSFAAEWRAWFPALERSARLLAVAADEPREERGRTLDRALDVTLSGAHDRLARFVERVEGPATATYAFGVLLPMATVALLPAARAAGVPVTTAAFVAVYGVCLPVGLLSVTAWLLVRRPVAFPPPAVPRSHPDVPTGSARTVVAAVGAGAAGLALAWTVLPRWTVPVAVVGPTLGAGLIARYRPVTAVRARVRDAEAALGDALSLIGHDVATGTPVERSVVRAGEQVPGETGVLFADVGRRVRGLGVGVREAFLGPDGPLATRPSPRLRSAGELVALAAVEGRPAGDALVETAAHVESLQRVEREARRELSRVTGTLRTTASLFGPLVAGATVALSDRMQGGLGLVGDVPALPTPVLGLAVGWYVLATATVLTVLAVGLEHGLDRSLLGYRVGRALCLAAVVFLGGFAAVAGLF